MRGDEENRVQCWENGKKGGRCLMRMNWGWFGPDNCKYLFTIVQIQRCRGVKLLWYCWHEGTKWKIIQIWKWSHWNETVHLAEFSCWKGLYIVSYGNLKISVARTMRRRGGESGCQEIFFEANPQLTILVTGDPGGVFQIRNSRADKN